MNIPQFFSSQETPIEAALDYATRGIPVFPVHVRQDEKQERGIIHPLIVGGISGATTDVSKICTYWTGFPKALVGIPTGSKTGLLVLQANNSSGVQNLERLSIKESFEPEETLSICTPFGKYYFYQYPMLPGKTLGCTSNIIDGIDIIGEGGSIVLPPLAFWTLTKSPAKIIKVGGIKYGHSMTHVNEVKITDYDVTKQVKPFPNGLLSYLKDFVIDDTETVQSQKACKSTRIGSQILYAACSAIKKINTRNGCDHDIGAYYEQYVEEIASYVASGEINENEAIIAINTAVKASEELIFEHNIRHTHEGWIKGFQSPKTSLDYYKEMEEKEKKKTKEDEQIAQSIECDYENAKLPELPMVCLPEEVQTLIRRVCLSMNCDTWMPFAVLLKAVAACVGANVLLEHSAFTNPTHQWIVLVCESGTGKSAVNEYISRPIINAQSLLYAEYRENMKVYEREKMEWEARVKAKMKDKGAPEPGDEPKKPISIEYYVDDITPESLVGTLKENPTGVVWDSDEFATFIRSFGRYAKSGGGDPAKSRILGMYDGHTISYKRVKNGGLTDQVKKGWLSVFGTVQPNILPKLMTAEDFDSGFLQRFLFICSDPPPPASLHGRPRLEDQDPLVDKIIGPMLNWKRLEVRDFREEPDKPVKAHLQSSSEFYLNDFFENMQKNYYHMGDEFSRTRARRWQAQCVRLILALHCLDRALSGAPDGGGVVRESTVENGVCIFKCLMEHATHAEKLMTGQKTGMVHKTDFKIINYISDMIEKDDTTAMFYYTKTHAEGIKNLEVLRQRFAQDSIILTPQKISKKLVEIGFKKSKINIGVRMTMALGEYNKLMEIVKLQQETTGNQVTNDHGINIMEKDLDAAVKLAEEEAKAERDRVEARLVAINPRRKKTA